MKMPDALLFALETTAHIDENDCTKYTLDIKIDEGRSIVFCKNCKHYRRIIKIPMNCRKDAVGEVRIICDKWHGETRPDGFCHHGEEESK